jgi:ferredoxin
LTDDLCSLGVFELARLYRENKVSPVEAVEAHLQRCDRLNPVLNAFLAILRDSAMEAARAAESLFRAGVDLGPLQGVPVSVKDIIRVRGTRTTAASKVLLEEDLDQSDAAVVRRLRAAGAILFGKTNLHEFATGDPDPGGPFGLVQNPRLVGYHPGSSSSGAGAAVAAGLGVIAMKTIGGNVGGSYHNPQIDAPAALKWALQDPNVHTIIAGFTTFDQLEADVKVLREFSLSKTEKENLRSAAFQSGLYCQGCGTCLTACVKQLPIPDVMRAYMYVYGYRNLVEAQDLLSSLNLPADPAGTAVRARSSA